MWRTSLQRWNKWHPANHQERTAFLLNFNDISRYLVSSLKQKLPKGEVSLTQRRGIISLIPKKQSAWRIEKLETLTSIKFWLQNCIKSSCIRAQNCASSLNRQSPGGFWKAGPSQKIPASFTMLSHIPILQTFPECFFLSILKKRSIPSKDLLFRKHFPPLASALLSSIGFLIFSTAISRAVL